MLQTLQAMMAKRRTLPVFGMNLGTVGFLMNEYRPEALAERIGQARRISFHPLSMEVRTLAGSTVTNPTNNEMSLLLAMMQSAKREIYIHGPILMEQLFCDGELAASPASPTSSNRSSEEQSPELHSRMRINYASF